MTTRNERRRKVARWLAATASLLPFVLVIVAVTAGILGYQALDAAFPDVPKANKLFSTLAMFTGAYVALDGTHDPAMPDNFAVPAVLAFGTTLTAAASFILAMSRQAWDTLGAWRILPRLVVIGSGETAEAIVLSCAEHGVRSVLISDDRNAEAVRRRSSCTRLVVVRSLDVEQFTWLARWVLRRAQRAVIATDSDAANLRLRGEVLAAFDPEHRGDGFRAILAVVRDPELADALRPAVLPTGSSASFLPPEDITCPAENIAEHITHLVDAARTGTAMVRRVTGSTTGAAELAHPRVVVELVGAGASPLERTVRRWVTRLSAASSSLKGDELPALDASGAPVHQPIAPIAVGGPVGPEDFVIRLYVGDGSPDVLTAFLEARRSGLTPADLTIVVTDGGLLSEASVAITRGEVRGSREWLTAREELAADTEARRRHPLTLLVDAPRIGLDAHLVEDDISLQWARAFHNAYNLMFAAAWTQVPWEPGAALASDLTPKATYDERKAVAHRYSSLEAVRNMFRFLVDLDGAGELRRITIADDQQASAGRESQSPFTEAEIDQIARAEHDSWRARTWPGVPTGISRIPLLRRSKRWAHDAPLVREFSGSGVSCVRSEVLQFLGEGGDPGAIEAGAVWTEDDVDGVAQLRELLAEKIAQGRIPDEASELRRLWNYNRRIVTETYPAIAAMFGYEIVRRQV